MENVNRTGDFFSPSPGSAGILRGASREIFLFPWARRLPVPGRMRPPFSPPGREPSRGASLAPSGQFTSCVAPGGREAPGEPFRWGSPGPLRDDTKRGDPRVPPLWKHPPWGTGAGNPPATAKRPCPPPFCERGASSFYSALSTGRCQSTPKSQCAAAKREAEGIRKYPNVIKLRFCPNMKKHPPRFEWGGCFLTIYLRLLPLNSRL